MIPSIVFNDEALQNNFPSKQPKVVVTVSRGREVAIKNENLDEGLYIFRYDDVNDHFYGTKPYTTSLAFAKLEGMIANGVLRTTPSGKSISVSIDATTQQLPHNFTSMMKTLLGPDLKAGWIENYVFEIKAVEKVESTIERMVVTSETIEGLFRTRKPYDRDEDSDEVVEELFVAYIFYNDSPNGQQQNVLIDVGELWDENKIDLDDLKDIFSDEPIKRVSQHEWVKSLAHLSPEAKQEMGDQQAIAERTLAFDEIMKRNNRDFDSNL